MAVTYPGYGGLFVLGGIVDGSPRLNGALASSITTMSIDDNGTGTMAGVILGGDTFTIAGETGSPTHTVTAGTAFTIAGASCTSITFTPAIATGGVSDNATLTFTSNSVAQIKGWELEVEHNILPTNYLGQKWEGNIGGLGAWRGKAEANLDYGATQQAALIDRFHGATPTMTNVGLVFRYGTSKNLYGYAVPKSIRSQHPVAGIVGITFEFEGDSTLLKNVT